MDVGIVSGRPRVMYTKEDLQAMLPEVGDRLMRVPVVHSLDKTQQAGMPRACTVVEVNRERLWYRVRFDRTGYCVCYKVPGGDR